jgi:hypothetical protein
MLAKKCLFVGIFILLSLSLAIAAPPAVHPATGDDLVIDCLWGTPDAIDGDLSDWKLDAMTPAVLDTVEQLYSGQATWSGPDDSSGKFYMLWDDKNIYIAVVMKDDKLSQNKSGGDIWNADAIEIFFATTNAVGGHEEHYQYGFDFKEQTWNWCNMDGAGQSAIDYLEVACTITDDGYICEAAIEYGQMLSLDFSVGNDIGFHPVFDDTDDGDRELQMTWTGREAHDQSLGYGYLHLSDAAVRPGYASGPSPANGALNEATWVTLGWRAGEFAASHDVYLGDNFDDVNEATRDSEVFRGNQTLTFYVAGFPGYAYPDGLVPGTTYYWRIDEVNAPPDEAVYKGDVWSFSIPSKSAYGPVPANGGEFVPTDTTLTWTPGFGAKLHTVYIGEDFDTVSEATGGASMGVARYTPGQLKLAKTYYWRVDEFDGAATYKGDVWSFTTEGAVTGPNPADGAVDISPTQALTWTAGAVAASHEVYFGSDADAVKNATKSSPEYKGPKALGEESYDPGKLSLTTTYYWRIDEVNGVNPDSPWAGNVWSFTTGDFFVIDDFEDYDTGENQIWYSWHDGLGYGSQGTPDYYAGNGTGAAVGDETTASYTEETIIHGGGKSMPVNYDNNKQGYSNYSEVEHTLSVVRDWTAEGVAELSLWFRGYPAHVGSFAEGPVGTYTMTGSGADIWNAADEFHFAYKNLTGVGSIVAKVLSVDNTDPWAKAGVMIRETLEPGSKFAAVYITPENGCRFQARLDANAAATSDTAVVTTAQTAITAPYWVKLERDIAGNFRASYSANGTTWTSMSWNPQNILMSSNIYVGLAVTSHDPADTCQAKFSNVTITGTVGAQWMNQDIGILSNDAEPLYVAVSNSSGNPAVVVHEDPAAAVIDTWIEWVIPLQAFADQGINLSNVDKIAIGLGTRGNMTIPGGSGKMFFDDIRLNRPQEAAE